MQTTAIILFLDFFFLKAGRLWGVKENPDVAAVPVALGALQLQQTL